MTAKPAALLKQYFGHSSFRPGQQELVEALLSGRDVLGVMPTGAGKSVCYQLPALLLPGLTLVVSPLISLMKDQVTALVQAGIPCAYLNSSLTQEQQRTVFHRAGQGAYKLLYVAPERLTAPSFLQFVQGVQVSLLAVDEAHCVSQWGQDFRPSYLEIARFAAQLPSRPVLGAFTATATAQVKDDIQALLGLRAPLRITTGFDRPNLYFEVARPQNKLSYLRAFLSERPGHSGIVYCATRKTVDSVYDSLRRDGVPVARYHAGLEDALRRQNQEDFVYDRARVMVATNAFGMGIDKSNVSFVVHYNMPKDLESYYQEAGRAGRDGAKARCVLLFSAGDVRTARYLIQNASEREPLSPEERAAARRRDLERLEQMTAYCKSTGCLRAYLLSYFGEAAPDRCGNCGGCAGETVRRDITLEAQKILSAVVRVEQRYPSGLGLTLIARMLRGSKERRVLQLGLDRLPTYGIMADTPQAQLLACIDCLLQEGFLTLDGEEYPVLRATGRARQVLFHGERVWQTCQAQPQRSPAAPAPASDLPGGELAVKLKALRTRLAQEAGLPAYMIFSNATLAELAARRPGSRAELLQVPGVGEVKAARYGQAFLDLIREDGRAPDPRPGPGEAKT